MPSYVIRRLHADLIARAKAKARESDTTLDAVLTRYLKTYAAHGSPQAAGARAVNAQRTPTERSEAGRRAAAARWRDHSPTPLYPEQAATNASRHVSPSPHFTHGYDG